MTEAAASTNKRSETMPTTVSTTSSTSSSKSSRVLVYEMAETRTREMSRAKFEALIAGKGDAKDYASWLISQTGVSADYISYIPIPRGASYIDISPDDLRMSSTEEIRSQSPEHMDGSGYISETKSKPYSRSYTANVHIPASVFYTRMIVPRLYPDLIVITKPIQTSPESSRSNTSNSRPEHQ